MERKLKLKVKEFNTSKEIKEISLTSHSKKEPLTPYLLLTSLFKKKEKMHSKK